jgi:hypothetical protein
MVRYFLIMPVCVFNPDLCQVFWNILLHVSGSVCTLRNYVRELDKMELLYNTEAINSERTVLHIVSPSGNCKLNRNYIISNLLERWYIYIYIYLHTHTHNQIHTCICLHTVCSSCNKSTQLDICISLFNNKSSKYKELLSSLVFSYTHTQTHIHTHAEPEKLISKLSHCTICFENRQ